MRLTSKWAAILMVAVILSLVLSIACCAQNKTAYKETIGAGGIDFRTGGTTYMSLKPGVNPAGGSFNPFDWTGTLGIMDGSDDFTLFDINLTNANHTSTSNTVQVLDIAGITGDAQCTETAINIGSGWDSGLTNASPSVLQIYGTAAITCAAGTTALDSTYYGKVTFVSGDAAQTITLPANGATVGSWMKFIMVGTDSTVPTFAAATADTLIAPNDAAADSVTFGTGHRIGSAVMFISTGSYWVAINLGSTTMTVAT